MTDILYAYRAYNIRLQTFNLIAMKKFLLILILSGLAIQLQARTVSGFVLGHDSVPLPGASCIILSLPDTAFVAAAITKPDGYFSMTYADSINGLLRISYLGYKPSETQLSDSLPGNFFLIPSSRELAEVIVSNERPQLVLKDGALSYNVGNIIKTNIVSSVHDLLKRLPLVTSPDGETLNLSGAPNGNVIYINGKRSQLNGSQLLDYLKGIPATQVADVQIIYNPPPEWKTTSSVINVVLKRQAAYTLNGKIQTWGKNRRVNSLGAGGSMFLGLPKWCMSLMYDFTNGHSRQKENSLARHTVAQTVYLINDTILTDYSNIWHNLYASASYEFDKGKTIEATYNGSFSPKVDNRSLSRNSLTGNHDSSSQGNSRLNGITLSFRSASVISAGLEYLAYKATSDQLMGGTDLKNGEDKKQPLFSSHGIQEIDRIRAYADLSGRFPKGWSINYGVSFDLTHSSNRYDAYSEIMEDVSPSESSTDEYIYKAYAGVYKAFLNGKLSFNASISGEIYKIGDYRKNGLYPNLGIYCQPSQSHILRLGFSSFKNYPSFWQRQEYISYSNPYHMNIGNPELKPARYNIYSLSYVFKNKYVLSASYYRVNDFFFSQAYMSPDDLLQIRKMFNLNVAKVLDISIVIPLKIRQIFSSDMTLRIDREQYSTSDWHGLAFDRHKWFASIYLQNSLIVCQRPRMSIDISGFYKSPGITGLWEQSDIYGINASFSCSMFDDRLKISLQANDIFESQSSPLTESIGNQWMRLDMNYYQRSFILNLSYSFKGFIERRKKISDTSRFGIDS